MADTEEVETILHELVTKIERVDPSYRAMLPSRRTVQADLLDLDRTYHAFWRHGKMSELHEGPAPRADIRISCDSQDLIAMAKGELDFGTAYATNRVRIRASMTDLLRLRAVM